MSARHPDPRLSPRPKSLMRHAAPRRRPMENLLHGVISNGEDEEDGHAIALLGMTDVAAATSSLPMVAAISLGFSISVLLDPEREAFDGDPLTALETLALSVATALSVYTITFSLLEFYYIHLVAGAACLEDANPQRAPSDTSTTLTDKLVAAIDEFNGPRANARQTMWYSLSSLMLAIVCAVAKSTFEHWDDPVTIVFGMLTAAVLIGVVVVLWRTVFHFRSVYRGKVLGEHGISW